MIDWVIGGGFLLACVAVFFVMRAGWKNRAKRQTHVASPRPVPADLGEPLVTVDLLYVATADADDRLDRIVAHGLGFRARAEVTVHAGGVVMDIAGSRPFFIPSDDLREIGRATWTIDRVVEPDGLVQLGWRLGDLDVDTFLRDSGDPRTLVAAISSLISQATPATTIGDTTP